jgi:hypothetical protein
VDFSRRPAQTQASCSLRLPARRSIRCVLRSTAGCPSLARLCSCAKGGKPQIQTRLRRSIFTDGVRKLRAPSISRSL